MANRNREERKKTARGGLGAGMIYKDTAVLHGERGVTVYGCRKILCYSPERVCFCVGKRHLFVRGAELLCTSFNAGCVSVEGRVEGIGYCRAACGGECTELTGEAERA